MKQVKKNKKKKSGALMGVVLAAVLVLVAVALVLVIMAVSLIGGDAGAASDRNPVASTQPATEPSPVTQLEITSTETDMIVQTPYGKLYYPAELMEGMRVEQEIDGKNVIIRYYCKIDGVVETEVFSVWFGQKQELVCGTVASEKGTLTMVSIDMNLDIPGDDWDETLRLKTFSLQEGVNHLMQRLTELETFRSANQGE